MKKRCRGRLRHFTIFPLQLLYDLHNGSVITQSYQLIPARVVDTAVGRRAEDLELPKKRPEASRKPLIVNTIHALKPKIFIKAV